MPKPPSHIELLVCVYVPALSMVLPRSMTLTANSCARLVLLILRHQVVHVGLRLRELHLVHACCNEDGGGGRFGILSSTCRLASAGLAQGLVA